MSPDPDGIGKAHSDDGDRSRAVLRCQGRRRRGRDDDVHLEPDQLGCEIRQAVEAALRGSVLDDDVLALDPPELAQPLPERLEDAGIRGERAAVALAPRAFRGSSGVPRPSLADYVLLLGPTDGAAAARGG
jgi:hypothetical protein